MKTRRRPRPTRQRRVPGDRNLPSEVLLAHRELQLVRAYQTEDPHYIHVRQRKRDEARRRSAR